jgi:hypothetical protein
MAWVRLGEPTLLTLGGRQATMAAVAGEVARLALDVDVSGLRGSSGYKKQSYDFLVSSSSSLTAQLLAGGGESSSRDDVLLALWLGFVGKFDMLGPLYIGLLVPTRRGFGILTNLSPTRF